MYDERRTELEEAAPSCARVIWERRQAAGKLMLATEGSWQGYHSPNKHLRLKRFDKFKRRMARLLAKSNARCEVSR